MDEEGPERRFHRLRRLLQRNQLVRRLVFEPGAGQHPVHLVACLVCTTTVLLLAAITICRAYVAEQQLERHPPSLGSRAELRVSGDFSPSDEPPVFPLPEVPLKESLPHLSQDPTQCPLQYDRIPWEDVRDWKAQAYVLGGRARPACHNCEKSDDHWAQFCQFRSGGPVCPDWLKWQLTHEWVKRAEMGAPGAQERLTMTPCDLFPFLRGRTLWVMGDSQTLNWHKALVCFLFEFWDLRFSEPDPAHPALPPEFQGWCANLAQGARLCFLRANTGAHFERLLPRLPALGATPEDLMVMNFAVWANTSEEYAAELDTFARTYQANRDRLPEALWRDGASQHFAVSDGDYKADGSQGSHCQVIEGVELQPDNSLLATDPSQQTVTEGGWRNKLADPVIERLGLPVVRTWNESLWLWQFHLQDAAGALDCTHMCHPSAYQHWVWLLLQALRRLHPELAGPAWL